MYRLFETPARLSRSRSARRHSRCTPQQNANGRHKALCWQDFDMGIVSSRGKRGVGCPGALYPPASLYTLSRGVRGGSGPQEVRYLHLLDHIYPLITNGTSLWLGEARLDQTVRADLTALHWNIHKVIMEARRQNPASDSSTETPASPGPPGCCLTRLSVTSDVDCVALCGLLWRDDELVPMLRITVHNALLNVFKIWWREHLLLSFLSASPLTKQLLLKVKGEVFLANIGWSHLSRGQALGLCKASSQSWNRHDID